MPPKAQGPRRGSKQPDERCAATLAGHKRRLLDDPKAISDPAFRVEIMAALAARALSADDYMEARLLVDTVEKWKREGATGDPVRDMLDAMARLEES